MEAIYGTLSNQDKQSLFKKQKSINMIECHYVQKPFTNKKHAIS
jgi:hypothetical protein